MERLIKKDKNGRERFMDIRVEDLGDGTADIVKSTGVVDTDKVSVSRTNVKTGYEKAIARAQTIWNNEKTKCTQILPMLANKWEDRQKYISEPFYVQPKLDGVRLLVSKDGGISRTGKIVPGTEILGRGLMEGEYIDGEAYDSSMSFEELTSTFKTDPLKLKFHVFDYFDMKNPELPFSDRMIQVRGLTNSHYEIVETFLVQKHTDMQSFHDMFMSQGYEGTMIRDCNSVYEIGKRSNYLLKYKDFQTDEYEIVDVKEGTGREKGAAIWVCKVGDHKFSAKPEGTLESRKKYLQDKDKYIGKQLTVRYQNLTTLGIPRFPVGVAVRDYE
jgi:ATP-dependent DNA ligase